ncbi:MAG TPA: DUF5916 domain-containing protein [Thermoanaerobaculia bacterium]|nr:DUF5916 domain-containing protein [Thermoanaerobaculia bacterium]
MRSRGLCAVVFLLSLGATAEVPPTADEAPAGPAKRTYEARLADGEVAVDGRLDEPTWAGEPTFTLDYETYPGDNVAAPVETEVWIAYDLRHLYVGMRAHDPEPEKIRARLRDRDAAFQDDFVGVVLDTFNDERRAFEFFVNPLGVQMDLVRNDVTGSEDESWDALWDSAGRLTEAGYEVEMAIPFSSLRFPRTEGVQTWGIDALRIWPRDQRRRLGLNELPRGRNCYLCSGSKLIGFAGVTPGRNLELAPTLTATDASARSGAGEPFAGTDDQELGLTVRWGVTPATTLGAALNPDFSQVEADAAQLSVNTQFALFFPEKRPFFLEGADLFDTRIGAVYTRNVADPDWGVKLTGKSGRSAYGAVVARDTRTNLLIPGSQGSQLAFLEEENTSTVLRYRRDLSGSSALGGLVTSREGDGYHNRLAGIDGLFRWGEGGTFRLELLGSETAYPEAIQARHGQREGSLEGTAARVGFQRQTRSSTASLVYNDVSDDFRADLGFIPQAGYRKGYGLVERYWFADEGERRWSRMTVGAESTWTYDRDGEPLQQQVAPYFRFSGPRQSFVHAYLGLGPSWFNGRELDRAFVVYGELQATPDVDGGRLYTANLTDFRASYQLNVRTFVRLVTQYFDLERDPALYTFPTEEHASRLANQLLFSYKVNPQTVVFLGYSDRFLGEERSIDRLAQTDRTLFLKLGYALVL